MSADYIQIILGIISVVVAVISVALVIVGWKIVISDARKLATRNETFAMIKDFADHVGRLRDEGVNLWLSSDPNKRIHHTAKINCELKTIRRSIEKLSSSRNISLTASDLIEMRRALTLSYNHEAHLNSIALTEGLTKIFIVSNELKWKAFSSFENQHKPKH